MFADDALIYIYTLQFKILQILKNFRLTKFTGSVSKRYLLIFIVKKCKHVSVGIEHHITLQTWTMLITALPLQTVLDV